MASTLHIASGDAAAICIRQALGCEDAAVLVHHDVVSCGRLARFESIEQWRQLRGEFWLPIVQVAAYDEPTPNRQDRGFELSNHDVLECADRLAGADAVVLWLGTALSDQLLLAWTVHLFELLGVAIEKLALVQIAALPGDARELLGIGMLSPAQLQHHPAGAAPDQLRLPAQTWRTSDSSISGSSS